MRRIGLMVAVAAIAIGVAMACAPLAGAARRTQLRLVAPHDGASVRVLGRALVVRLRASGPDFMATLDGHDVTARFRRARGGVRSARFVRGRDFDLGRGSFLAAVGKRYSSARRAVSFSFTARRPVHRMLSMRSETRATSAGRSVRSLVDDLFGPLGALGAMIPRASAFVSLHSPRHPSALRLTVNGHRATSDLTSLGDGRRAAGPLGASTGLRYGRNRVVGYMEGPHWTYARRSIRLRVPRSAPLAGAGGNRRAGVGDTTRLNGSKSRAPRRGMRLLYRWRVASAPKGANVRLRHARSKKPLLRADTPGRYRLRLRVAALPRRHRGRSRRRRAPAFTGSASAAFAAAAARGEVATDSTTVTVAPTSDPMGAAIETMARVPDDDDTVISVQGVDVPRPNSTWAQAVVLDPGSLEVRESENIDAGDPNELVDLLHSNERSGAVAAESDDEIVIISGLGQPQTGDSPALLSAMSKAVDLLGGTMPDDDVANRAVKTGNWSIIGTPGVAGRVVENIDGVSQASVHGAPSSTAPGSINGYLQDVTSAGGSSFVSPEFVPINTYAKGSTNTKSVFQIGSQTYASPSIANGALGIHLVAVNRDASMKPLWNQTFTIVNPNDQTNQGSFDKSKGTGTGVAGLAYTLQTLTHSPLNLLIVMQTVGTSNVAPWTAPGASPNWVNDALIQPGSNGLWQWNGQSYSSSLLSDLDSLWNPGYPTVAGQVGLLTGQAGHDLIANFGGDVGVDGHEEVTRLSMVANNHPYDPSMNYVKGFAAPKPDQLVGTLTRTSESQWRVSGGVPTDKFGGPELWELAFQPATSWPMSNGAANKAAMAYIAGELWPNQGITDVRPQYALRDAGINYWGDKAGDGTNELGSVKWPGKGHGFNHATFKALIGQLRIEMADVQAVTDAIRTWQGIISDSSSHGYVALNTLTSKITSDIIADNAQLGDEQASVDPLEIASDALLVGGSLLGFPEFTGAGDVVEQIAVAAHVFDFAGATLGLADSASGESSGRSDGPNTALVADKASMLGQDLYKRFDIAQGSLGHLADIYVSDWGKLKQAAANAGGNWAIGSKALANLQQSLSVTTEQGFYRALLPLAYRQWVISPYFTVSNGTGPNRPGTDYQCIHYRSATEGNQIQRPFEGQPSGAMSWVNYRPWEAPGATTQPAQPYTTNYTVRALKSWEDPLTLQTVDLNGSQQAVTIDNWGANPPSDAIDDLFEPVNKDDPDPQFPTDLGMSKTEFYATYAGGVAGEAWGRMICAVSSG